MEETICRHCGKVFYVYRAKLVIGKGKYCSKACYHQGKKTAKIINCNSCGVEFTVSKSSIGKRKFCSKKCWGIYLQKNPLPHVFKHNHKVKGGYRWTTENSSGPLATKWKGGRFKNLRGYTYAYAPQHPFRTCQGYVLEHRLVVEKIIGRYLLKGETVHHIGDKSDNQAQSLIAFRTMKAHIRFERLNEEPKARDIIFDGRKV